MPLLEKMLDETLVLQEYTLSEAQCRGLAKAIPFFDNQRF